MILRLARDWVWLQRSQWLRKDQLAEIQARKLREIVSHAYQKVPFYHRLYDAAGVDQRGRSRSLVIKRTLRFLEYDGRIWDLLEMGEHEKKI